MSTTVFCVVGVFLGVVNEINSAAASYCFAMLNPLVVSNSQ